MDESTLSAEADHTSRKSRLRSAVDTVKEWGGVATLVIAILYTFPFSLVDRYVNSTQQARAEESRGVESLRQSISEMASLRSEKAYRLTQSTDPRYQNEISSSYYIRIYNAIYIQKDNFRKWASLLRSSELYWIGGSLALIGEVGEAQYYYDEAVIAAEKENNPETKLTVLRERAASLFAETRFQNLPEARNSFLELLNELSKRSDAASVFRYVVTLSELVGAEMVSGSYHCGRSNADLAMSMFAKLRRVNDNIAIYQTMFSQNLASSAYRASEKHSLCEYKLPIHPFFA